MELSVPQTSTLVQPTGLQRWFNRWRPSSPIRRDPLQHLLLDGRFAPVGLSRWKLIAPMRDEVLARRVAHPLTLTGDQRLTIIIPYRDREAHLQELLPSLQALLTSQGIAHRILVVEQEPGELFNRGKLVNSGLHYAAQTSDYYCIHDVDAVPVVADYRCPSQPLRLVHRIVHGAGEWHRPVHYFSGAISVARSQVFAANGFSNEYRGWGKEDDDFFFRLLLAGFTCYYDTQSVFRDLPNPQDQQVQRRAGKWPPHVVANRRRRSDFLRGQRDPATDGLSTLRYRVIDRQVGPAHEKILVRWPY